MRYFFVFLMTLNLTAYSQQKDADSQSKMDVFASATGSIVKFSDYNLESLGSSYGIAETRIRKVKVKGESKVFFQITKDTKYGTKKASIAYEDLLDIIKAIPQLKSDAQSDLTDNADYLENKFVTDDGFEVGYYVSNGKIRWYLVLEKYGSDNTFFLNDVISAESLFNRAKVKMEELSKL